MKRKLFTLVVAWLWSYLFPSRRFPLRNGAPRLLMPQSQFMSIPIIPIWYFVI